MTSYQRPPTQQQPPPRWNGAPPTHQPRQPPRRWNTTPQTRQPQQHWTPSRPSQAGSTLNDYQRGGAGWQCSSRQGGSASGQGCQPMSPTAGYSQPPATLQRQQFQGVPAPPTPPNPRKFHQNNYFCWSCGFDVDHPGGCCPAPNWGHQPEYTRYNLQQYLRVGRWSTKGAHKTQMRDGTTLQWDNTPRQYDG